MSFIQVQTSTKKKKMLTKMHKFLLNASSNCEIDQKSLRLINNQDQHFKPVTSDFTSVYATLFPENVLSILLTTPIVTFWVYRNHIFRIKIHKIEIMEHVSRFVWTILENYSRLVFHWHKNVHIDLRKRIESLKINPDIYGQLMRQSQVYTTGKEECLQ